MGIAERDILELIKEKTRKTLHDGYRNRPTQRAVYEYANAARSVDEVIDLFLSTIVRQDETISSMSTQLTNAELRSIRPPNIFVSEGKEGIHGW